jgi:cell division protein FtsL
MGTRLSNRPIDKDISSETLQTNASMSLKYNLEEIEELFLSNFDDALVKIKGVQVTLVSTNKPVLNFNNANYVFDKILITNDFDKISQNSTNSDIYNIAIILVFVETNGIRNIYVTLPLESGLSGSTSNSQTFINTLLGKVTSLSSSNTSRITLDEAFNLNDLMEESGFNKNQYVYYTYSSNSLFIVTYLENALLGDNDFDLDSLSSIFSTRNAITSGITTSALYIMTTVPTQESIISNSNNDDIYIDCSPISSDASYQIIEPRKLKLQANVFNNVSKLISSNKIIILIVAITVLMIILYTVYNSFSYVSTFVMDILSMIPSIPNISLADTKNLGTSIVDKAMQYNKAISIQNGTIMLLRIIAMLSMVCLMSIIVLQSIQGSVDEDSKVFQIFKIILWVSVIIAISGSTLLSFLKVLFTNKMNMTTIYSMIILLIGILSIICIALFKKYISMWEIIDENTNSEKVFLGTMWGFVIVFSVLTIVFYSPLKVLDFGSDFKENEQKIVDEIMRADAFIFKLKDIFTKKSNGEST